jgi:DNA-directed RNA polymerase beta subunit
MEFQIIEKYMKSEGIISHHTNSYNLFVNFLIQKIFDEITPIAIKDGNSDYTTTFGQVYIDKPFVVEEDTRTIKHITPYEARMREMFYEAQVSVDIIETHFENGTIKEEKINRKQHICRVPVMVGSSLCNLYGLSREEWIAANECEYDFGGYFIIKGKERVLIPQERINYNVVYTFRQPTQNKWMFTSEIRSMSDETGHSVLVQAKIEATGKQIVFSLPYIGEEIPAGYVLRALGMTNDEIRSELTFDDLFVNTILRAACRLKTQSECLEYIGEKSLHIIPKERRVAYAEQVIDNELFPHLGVATRKTFRYKIGNIMKIFF